MSAGPNVLVVDDEPGMLRYMKTVLELDSYKVSTAHCGEDAIQSVRDGAAPDLVLLDLVCRLLLEKKNTRPSHPVADQRRLDSHMLRLFHHRRQARLLRDHHRLRP